MEADLKSACEMLAKRTLPRWNELPDLELYMDQVTSLIGRYLKDDRELTASMVNNYVKHKAMPAPVRKKYTREHLAYLIMICTLKQSVNMTYVQRMIPMGLTPEQVKERYEHYIALHRATCELFLEQTRIYARPVTHFDGSNPEAVEDLVFLSAIVSGFSKLLTEKIVRLEAGFQAQAKQEKV